MYKAWVFTAPYARRGEHQSNHKPTKYWYASTIAHKLRNKLHKNLTLSSLLYSCQRASRGKFSRIEILRFNQSKLFGLSGIHATLSQNAYTPSLYNHFYINDPKPRSIMSLPFTDRIIHQWVVEELIKPYYVPRFIAQTYACIPGRGTHAAVRQAQAYLCRSLQVYRTPYIIKLDIAKFFHSIDTPTLFAILRRDIEDPELLALLHTIIFHGVTDAGLPIGNYTSQYFANIYLNELDQYIKRTLHVTMYVRYMDDFLCFVDSKSEAKQIYRAIEQFLHDELRLQLNPKSRYFPAHHRLDFCGYKIYPRYILLRDRSKRRLCQIIDDFEQNLDSEERFEIRVNAWLGHALHASSYHYATKKLGPYATRFDRLAPTQKSSPWCSAIKTAYQKGATGMSVYSLWAKHCRLAHSRKGLAPECMRARSSPP